MIHLQLRCSAEHGFDGWFRSSAAFAEQLEAGLVACPECGDTAVRLGLMAPAVPRKGRKAASGRVVDQEGQSAEAPAPAAAKAAAPPAASAAGVPDQLRAALQKLRSEVEKNCEHVGDSFAAEARKIHNGETEARPIYGHATPEQAESLADDGIEVARIPWIPRADS